MGVEYLCPVTFFCGRQTNRLDPETEVFSVAVAKSLNAFSEVGIILTLLSNAHCVEMCRPGPWQSDWSFSPIYGRQKWFTDMSVQRNRKGTNRKEEETNRLCLLTNPQTELCRKNRRHFKDGDLTAIERLGVNPAISSRRYRSLWRTGNQIPKQDLHCDLQHGTQ